jgi:hypothetical protein
MVTGRELWPVAAADAPRASATTRRVANFCLVVIVAPLLVEEAGCSNVLGFQDAVYVNCILNSDCPGSLVCIDRVCSPECNTDKDCERTPGRPTCEDNACVQEDGGAPDAGDCASVCASGICFDGRCGTLATYGYAPTPSSAAPFQIVASGLGPSSPATLTGVLVRVFSPGTVVKLGLVSIFGGEHIYVGLYRDGGGMPTELLAQNAQPITIPGTSEYSNAEDVDIPVPSYVIDSVVDPVNGDAYWMLEESDQPMVFQVSSATTSSWYEFAEPAFGSLPARAPASSAWNTLPTPALFLTMAQ